jgi:malto-oligosyltrehalose trehalohydrolase
MESFAVPPDSDRPPPAAERASADHFRHAMPFGAEARPGAVRFQLWAPSHERVSVEIEGAGELAMTAKPDGWHELTTDRAQAGALYRFVLPDGARVSDPASRFQPDDVHGPSEVIDPLSYAWRETDWRGRPWSEAVIYELHVGAFTPEGTFAAAIDKLDHLVDLGVTAIEIMPVGDFPGWRNWGYDGVLPFAPDAAYGRPEDFKALIDAAHARRLMVFLDVVYNHFGPEGAYIHTVAPETFTDRHTTPWGAAINADGDHSPTVRAFFIHNALYWIEEFHLDGLRLDAAHAIPDDSETHIIEELARRVRDLHGDRHIHLILENEHNEASRLRRDANGEPLSYTAQWNDDMHHVLHVAASGESSGYYADYQHLTPLLGRALSEGFAYQGETMPYRGSPRGEPSAGLPPGAFVSFLQNHDQVGNRAFGDRITAFAPEAAVRAAAAVYLLLPQIPMLFMGEEWGADQPFPFFCDFAGDLAEAVREGRRNEFARFPEFRDPESRSRIPDPTAPETFLSAKLAWDDIEAPPHAQWLAFYRSLLDLRRARIVPILPLIKRGGVFVTIGDRAVLAQWRIGAQGYLSLAANLADQPCAGFPNPDGDAVWREGEAPDDGAFGPFAVRWTLTDAPRSPPAL